jgi:hypothetical protein
MARMTPGAPSETTSEGSPRPRIRMSWKNARTVSVSSFEPAIRWSRTLRLSSPMPQAAITASRGWPARSRSAILSTSQSRAEFLTAIMIVTQFVTKSCVSILSGQTASVLIGRLFEIDARPQTRTSRK